MSRFTRRNRQREAWVERTIDLAHAVRNALEQTPADAAGRLRREAWWSAIQQATGVAGGQDECRSLVAETFAAAAAVALAESDTVLQTRTRRWLLASADPLVSDVLNDLVVLLTGEGEPVEPSLVSSRSVRAGLQRIRDLLDSPFESPPDSMGHLDRDSLPYDFFEHFLATYDSGHRRNRGVFYTPRPIARFIVARLDQQIRDEFGIAGGLADPITWSEFAARHSSVVIPRGAGPDEPFLRLLEPALGTGVFLDEVIDRIHRRICSEGVGDASGAIGADWDDYVQRCLLPRLIGLEIMLPACVVAHLRLASRLARTGFSFERVAPIGIHLADTLAGPADDQLALFPDPSDRYREAVRQGRRAAFDRCATVVFGNPPFSGISQADGRWITELLRGGERRTRAAANYYRAADQPLGERKVWLQDDYVKFLRFAHWKIEQAGCGAIGLITNHGYLDNPTFRGVRYQLMHTFSRIDVVDLHGNRKKKEICPDGSKDENVFGIDQGTAIGLFRRVPGILPVAIRHRELWGTAASKLDAMNDPTDRSLDGSLSCPSADAPETIVATNLSPQRPHFLFVPRDESPSIEYRGAWSLVEIFPINVTAPVTARDHFVVAMDRDELLGRLNEFCDLTIPDDMVRRRFTNSRSRRYAPGDTRGWSLHEARRRLAADDRWPESIRTCWYRPFDRRHILWSNAMIDWPRDEVTGHLLAGPNLALIARRQMLPTQPCNYFWIADDLALDGIIRSDNRGSESLFPLYTYSTDDHGLTTRQANLSPRFVAELASALDLTPVAESSSDLSRMFGAEDVLHYIYALFHSTGYRSQYADLLRADFPRVLVPRQTALFAEMVRCGRRLADAHLLRLSESDASSGKLDVDDHHAWTVAAGYPKFADGRVRINPQCVLATTSPRVWEFHAGGHQVCRKWLKDRRGRMLRPADRLVYRRMIKAIEQTLDAMQQIEHAISNHGGWRAAFRAS